MNRVPDWKLERYALGELPPQEMEAVRALARGDDELARRLAALESSNREILTSHPFRAVGPAILARAGQRPRAPARTWALPVLALAAGAALALVALPGAPPELGSAPWDDVTYKGLSPSLRVHRQVGGGDETLAERAPVRAGEVLRLGYVAGADRYGVIVSLDGRGAVTLHHPLAGEAQALSPEGEVLLGRSYLLDDAPDFERFVLVSSDHPVDVDAVLSAARALAADPARAARDPLPLDPALRQTPFTVRKTP